MTTTVDFIEFVCEQISGTGTISHKKMFGEYMVYVDDKPIFLICDNTVFVKQLDCVTDIMRCAEKGIPYSGAKEHYILDIDNANLSKEIAIILKANTPLPKSKAKKNLGRIKPNNSK